jgi:hypothetical protein
VGKQRAKDVQIMCTSFEQTLPGTHLHSTLLGCSLHAATRAVLLSPAIEGRSSAWPFLCVASRGFTGPTAATGPRHGSMVGGRSKLQTSDLRPQTQSPDDRSSI